MAILKKIFDSHFFSAGNLAISLCEKWIALIVLTFFIISAHFVPGQATILRPKSKGIIQLSSLDTLHPASFFKTIQADEAPTEQAKLEKMAADGEGTQALIAQLLLKLRQDVRPLTPDEALIPESPAGANTELSGLSLKWYEIGASVAVAGLLAFNVLGLGILASAILAVIGAGLGIYLHEMHHFVRAREFILKKTNLYDNPLIQFYAVGRFHQELKKALEGEPNRSPLKVVIDKSGIRVIYPEKLLTPEENLIVKRSGSRANVKLGLTFAVLGLLFSSAAPVFITFAAASLTQALFSTFREGRKQGSEVFPSGGMSLLIPLMVVLLGITLQGILQAQSRSYTGQYYTPNPIVQTPAKERTQALMIIDNTQLTFGERKEALQNFVQNGGFKALGIVVDMAYDIRLNPSLRRAAQQFLEQYIEGEVVSAMWEPPLIPDSDMEAIEKAMYNSSGPFTAQERFKLVRLCKTLAAKGDFRAAVVLTNAALRTEFSDIKGEANKALKDLQEELAQGITYEYPSGYYPQAIDPQQQIKWKERARRMLYNSRLSAARRNEALRVLVESSGLQTMGLVVELAYNRDIHSAQRRAAGNLLEQLFIPGNRVGPVWEYGMVSEEDMTLLETVMYNQGRYRWPAAQKRFPLVRLCQTLAGKGDIRATLILSRAVFTRKYFDIQGEARRALQALNFPSAAATAVVKDDEALQTLTPPADSTQAANQLLIQQLQQSLSGLKGDNAQLEGTIASVLDTVNYLRRELLKMSQLQGAVMLTGPSGQAEDVPEELARRKATPDSDSADFKADRNLENFVIPLGVLLIFIVLARRFSQAVQRKKPRILPLINITKDLVLKNAFEAGAARFYPEFRDLLEPAAEKLTSINLDDKAQGIRAFASLNSSLARELIGNVLKNYKQPELLLAAADVVIEQALWKEADTIVKALSSCHDRLDNRFLKIDILNTLARTAASLADNNQGLPTLGTIMTHLIQVVEYDNDRLVRIQAVNLLGQLKNNVAADLQAAIDRYIAYWLTKETKPELRQSLIRAAMNEQNFSDSAEIIVGRDFSWPQESLWPVRVKNDFLIKKRGLEDGQEAPLSRAAKATLLKSIISKHSFDGLLSSPYEITLYLSLVLGEMIDSFRRGMTSIETLIPEIAYLLDNSQVDLNEPQMQLFLLSELEKMNAPVNLEFFKTVRKTILLLQAAA